MTNLTATSGTRRVWRQAWRMQNVIAVQTSRILIPSLTPSVSDVRCCRPHAPLRSQAHSTCKLVADDGTSADGAGATTAAATTTTTRRPATVCRVSGLILPAGTSSRRQCSSTVSALYRNWDASKLLHWSAGKIPVRLCASTEEGTETRARYM